MYRVGWPFWKLLAKAGLPVRLVLTAHYNINEKPCYWANSPNIEGVFISGDTFENTQHQALNAARDLFGELSYLTSFHIQLRLVINESKLSPPYRSFTPYLQMLEQEAEEKARKST